MRRNVPLSSVEIMLGSISSSSYKQYEVYWKKWFDYCNRNKINLYEASISSVLEFLTELYNNGSQYGSLNSSRAALSLILGPSISEDTLLTRFFKGVFRLRPPAPKYDITWDTNCVLNFLSTLYPNENITLEKLTQKCITLLALVTAHRVQTLSKIKIQNIESTPSQLIIKIPDLIKTSRVGCNQPTLYLPFFQDKPAICPAKTLLSYINKTTSIRKSDSLFISFKKPHSTVSTQTLSRWIKSTLKDSGIDTNIFSAHSTRHASTSQAHNQGVNIDLIRKTAGWSGTSNIFSKFYHREIISANHDSLARAILNNNQ